ncbi:putative acyltransferase [uncultured Clostridium sp.]|uniref:GNAT family N-acetyltransferase n=1 Tax=uncultured Clostridium sp. TaxID=59620 RepID=UPI0008229FFA|nr:GNAT family N-acetyltransferase [uncultured Clostridium sp.]SCJ89915.1 putative acyltransferase [uncultured Clostridium sp.]
MSIRRYESRDCNDIIKLFYDTVHTINSKDYAEDELNAWAPKDIDISLWDKSFLKNYTIVFILDNVIVGFGDINETGYLDRLYIHKDYQRRGIAKKIVDNLECYVKKFGVDYITTEASITAKPFFERMGYKIIKEQQVEKREEYLTNYIMKKHI